MNNHAPYTPIVVDVKTAPRCKLCNDTGEQRYWEGRWRDEKAENERLRAEIKLLKNPSEATTYYGSDNPILTYQQKAQEPK